VLTSSVTSQSIATSASMICSRRVGAFQVRPQRGDEGVDRRRHHDRHVGAPTSDHIYQTIGYVAVADVDRYTFSAS
jgi:hypothetical protein